MKCITWVMEAGRTRVFFFIVSMPLNQIPGTDYF